MLFSEPGFLFAFLPLLLLIYYVAPRALRNPILLVFSLGFYAWGEKQFVLLMLLSIAFNYAIGIRIDRAARPRTRRGWLIVGIVGDLGLLVAFKYANFLVDNLNALLVTLDRTPVELAPVHLPIGISFFTFQAMSYVIDTYRRETTVQRDPFKLALYVALFPQLIAGPIVRYHDVAKQLVARRVTRTSFARGVQRFLVGLGKKMIIANGVAYPADQIFALPPGEVGPGLAWLGMICYTLQIYFDFSGYSDMAIGLGRMFGFRFLENFRYPYISTSITEFWRRWHISLSSWYRDYLYIPLGGNRGSTWQTYRNLLIVFFLCGLWHGASWAFVVWGLFHGALLIVERLGLGRLLHRAPAAARHAYTLLAVIVGWVFFRAESFPQALRFLAAMFGSAAPVPGRTVHPYLTPELLVILLVGAVGATPLAAGLWRRFRAYERRVPLERRNPIALTGAAVRVTGLALVLVYSLMLMAAGTYNPFIYFRF